MIQIECLQGTKFLNPDRYLDRDLDHFAPCKQGIGFLFNLLPHSLYTYIYYMPRPLLLSFKMG